MDIVTVELLHLPLALSEHSHGILGEHVHHVVHHQLREEFAYKCPSPQCLLLPRSLGLSGVVC